MHLCCPRPMLPPPPSLTTKWHSHLSPPLLQQATNLFRDGVKKRFSDLSSTSYSPAKKKGRCRSSGAGISPCNADPFVDAASDADNNEDKDYSPTLAYKIVCTARPKRRDVKVARQLRPMTQNLLLSPTGRMMAHQVTPRPMTLQQRLVVGIVPLLQEECRLLQ
jgi:hypothetical protein